MQNQIVVVSEEDIKEKIYYIRGKRVMIDSDLAKIYGYSTKAFNQQVQRNIDKFEEDFMFRLNNQEVMLLSRSQIVTLNKTRGHNIKYNPYVFTEEGIYMLMTVLKGELAVKQSKALIRIFKSMKDYLISNDLIEQKFINKMVIDHEKDIKLLQESFDKLSEKKKENEIYFNGQIYDARSKILEIFKESKKELIIIDTYADNVILDIIKRLQINVILITKKSNLLTNQDIEIYNKQYKNLKVIYNNTFHDRYFIIDNEKIYHCGASINRIGYKTFSINLIKDKDVCKLLIDNVKKLIK